MMKSILTSYLSISMLLASLVISSAPFAQTPSNPPNADASVSLENKSSTTNETAQYLLQSSALLYAQKNFAAAKNILDAINASKLNNDLYQQYVLQQATLAIASNDSNSAAIWLNKPILTKIPAEDIKKRVVLHELRAKTFLLKNSFFNCAKEYVELLSISYNKNDPTYVDALWDSLIKVDASTLANEQLKLSPGSFYDWIELALITKDNSLDELKKKGALIKWFSAHPNHPAPTALSTSKIKNSQENIFDRL